MLEHLLMFRLLKLDPLEEIANYLNPEIIFGIEGKQAESVIMEKFLQVLVELLAVGGVLDDGEVEGAEDALLAGRGTVDELGLAGVGKGLLVVGLVGDH